MQKAKLATKGGLRVRTDAHANLPKVRNKNAAIFLLKLVNHLPFTNICIELHKKHKEFILGLYRLTNTNYVEIVFSHEIIRDNFLRDGIQILDRRLSGYNNAQSRNFLTVTL